MSTRRPLANVPNATNSPHRAGLVPAKRARSGQIEIPFGQPPPKKQVMDAVEQDRSRLIVHQNTESKLFARRSNNANPSAFEKKLVAAREKERIPQPKGSRNEKPSADTMDTIRQWQRHYRKAFPQFVFYFDSIPEDVRRKFSRQVVALGACEEKFFSRLVTHVVTSRPIPAEATATTSPTEDPATGADGANGDNMQTVNPSLLEKNADSHLHVSLKTEARRDQGNMDVLQRARQMGMKIWALEKLQRMITTINDKDIGGQNESASRSKNVGGSTTHGRGENDLSRVLRQELLNGPSDRDPFASMEMVMFKGPFIYIHDMNEKTKPVMVREYARVNKRQDGAWPQFRSAPLGKCPFIDEPPSRKEYDRQRIRQAQKEKKAAVVKVEDSRSKPSTVVPTERAVENKLVTDLSKPKRAEDQPSATPVDVFAKPVFEDGHERKSSESLIPPHFPRTGPFYTGREPAASGVQPSNVTSAIRSQMISSTAAAPGAKAGLSKEVHGLKRKVLEKGTGSIVAGSMAAPLRPSTGSASFSSKQNDSNKLAVLEKNGHGDAHQTEGAGTKRRRDEPNDTQPQKAERKRDPKPGYCENCRDKFDDFEEHTMTRKHRRFAQNASNWGELDALLYELQRPLKDEYDFEEFGN
ncbi:Cdc7p-Dbf4p kinase complex regulatory subunit [Penicillium ochrochloron]